MSHAARPRARGRSWSRGRASSELAIGDRPGTEADAAHGRTSTIEPSDEVEPSCFDAAGQHAPRVHVAAIRGCTLARARSTGGCGRDGGPAAKPTARRLRRRKRPPRSTVARRRRRGRHAPDEHDVHPDHADPQRRRSSGLRRLDRASGAVPRPCRCRSGRDDGVISVSSADVGANRRRVVKVGSGPGPRNHRIEGLRARAGLESLDSAP